MAVQPSGVPPLSFALNPSSSASSATGLDMLGGHGGGMTGAVNIGSGGAEKTWLTGIVRDFAMGIAVALAAKYAWGRLK